MFQNSLCLGGTEWIQEDDDKGKWNLGYYWHTLILLWCIMLIIHNCVFRPFPSCFLCIWKPDFNYFSLLKSLRSNVPKVLPYCNQNHWRFPALNRGTLMKTDPVPHRALLVATTCTEFTKPDAIYTLVTPNSSTGRTSSHWASAVQTTASLSIK